MRSGVATVLLMVVAAACSPASEPSETGGTWVGTITTEGNVTTVVNESANQAAQRSSLDEQLGIDTAKVAADVGPAVVVIRSLAGDGTETERSGFTISADGILVTNLDAVSGKESVSVELPSGEVFASVDVLATDSARNIAILKILGTDLPHVELGDSDEVAVGDAVLAFGHPFGLDTTVSVGIVMAVRDIERFGTVLEIDAARMMRDGGGPVVNAASKVIGILPAQVPASIRMNLAIPINYVRTLLAAGDMPITLAEDEAGTIMVKRYRLVPPGER